MSFIVQKNKKKQKKNERNKLKITGQARKQSDKNKTKSARLTRFNYIKKHTKTQVGQGIIHTEP